MRNRKFVFEAGNKVHVVYPDSEKWEFDRLFFDRFSGREQKKAILLFESGSGFVESDVDVIRFGWVGEVTT